MGKKEVWNNFSGPFFFWEDYFILTPSQIIWFSLPTFIDTSSREWLSYNLKAINSSLNRWMEIPLWGPNQAISSHLTSLDSLPGWEFVSDYFDILIVTLESCPCSYCFIPNLRGEFSFSLLSASVPWLLKTNNQTNKRSHCPCPLYIHVLYNINFLLIFQFTSYND
jgi:hypothetical protein